ncbi:hypothetical protein RIF29_00222 [Crotalaria pallida]|uniref:Uncharacterized protein n=1 Tax=Crotalaria pallida TaxID=3830 RepID=A0AAN9P6F4_CROPI
MGLEKEKMLDLYTLEQRLERQLKELEAGDNSNQEVKNKRPKIQRVPPYMEGMGLKKYFNPKLISFGLFHHGQYDTIVGEQYKFMWTAMYLKDANQSHLDLYDKINSHYSEMNDSFRIDDGTSYHRQNIVSICMLDGCSILHVLDKSDNFDDAEKELKVSVEQLVRVHQDMLLLENQIPFQVLKIICNDNREKLDKFLENFLKVHDVHTTMEERQMLVSPSTRAGWHVSIDVILHDEEERKGDPTHLLDYLHRAMLIKERSGGGDSNGESQHKQRSLHLRKYRIGSIRELKDAGIGVEKHPNNTSFHPRFIDGKLRLPELTVDGSTALILLNLAAYEMCPDFSNDFQISSYVVFLSSLIDQPEDVKELRSANILINELSSDKEVSDLFNRMDALLVPETSRYAKIRDKIRHHIESNRAQIKMLGWKGEAYNTFCRSPWTIIGLLAATLALILTFIQTWFAINPKHS